MVGSGLQPDLNAILSIFSLYAGVILGYPRRHAAFPVRRTRLFCSCFVQLTLRAQTGTKHERQCAPHDGSLATVCGNSRGQRYGIENPKITYKKNYICEIV